MQPNHHPRRNIMVRNCKVKMVNLRSRTSSTLNVSQPYRWHSCTRADNTTGTGKKKALCVCTTIQYLDFVANNLADWY